MVAAEAKEIQDAIPTRIETVSAILSQVDERDADFETPPPPPATIRRSHEIDSAGSVLLTLALSALVCSSVSAAPAFRGLPWMRSPGKELIQELPVWLRKNCLCNQNRPSRHYGPKKTYA